MRTLIAVALMAVLAVFIGGSTRIVEAAPVTIDVQLVGANENPPVSGPGSAKARFTFDKDSKVLTYAVTVSGLSEGYITASHIHRGAVGVNGPAIFTLASGPFTQIAGSITLTDSDMKDLEDGNFYINVHSTVNPGGFARGQISLPKAPAPARPAVTPPSTGDAGLLDEGTGTTTTLFLALVGALTAGTTAIAMRRVH